MDKERELFAMRLQQLAQEQGQDAVRVLAEAVARLVDRRDIAEVEQWIVARACG